MPIVNFRDQSNLIKRALTPLEHKARDIARIANFLYATPQGSMFVNQQIGLQLMNPQLESNGKGFLELGSSNSTRLYNAGANTLAQVVVQGSGFHLNRHGLTPDMDEQDKYYNVVAKNDAEGKSRIIDLYKRLIAPSSTPLLTKDGNIDKVNNETVILSYNGGPNSILGIGETTLNRVYNTTNVPLKVRDGMFDTTFVHVNSDYTKNVELHYFDQLNLSRRILDPSKIQEVTGIDENRPYTAPLLDSNPVTNVIGKPLFRALPDSTTYNSYVSQYVKPQGDTQLKDLGIDYIDKRVNFQSPNGDQFIDGLNMVNIYSSDERARDPESYDKSERDLVKFKFELIDNDNPNKTDHLVFRSFLHPIENNVISNWNEINYLGRGDTFYTYNNYKETYSLGFDIMASSAGEMKPIWNKLNYLKSSLAPDYRGTTMRGSMVRLTIGNILNRVPGIIPNLNISVPEDAPWDIDIVSSNSGDFARELPRMLRVTFTFVPIYNHLIRKGKTVPFFSVDKLGYLNNDSN
jgi:hypothetical protein